MPIINSMENQNVIGIHIGAVTHHHDQSIVSVNFNTKKIRNRTVEIPVPPLVVLLV